MKISVLPDEEAIAEQVCDQIERLLNAKPTANIGVATGSSPLAIYRELGNRVQAGRISFAYASAFMLDEYVGLAPDHEQAYRNVIANEFCARVDIDPARVHGPNGQAEDLDAACTQYDDLIAASGGIDLQILGIGSDGHIAFNEPGGAMDSRTHVDVLTEQTRADNARFFCGDIQAVPTHCLTQGLGTIFEARQAILVAFGSGKAKAIHELVHGQINAQWPATIMQDHPNFWVYLDTAAASQIKK